MTTRRSFLTTSSLAAAAVWGTPWRLPASGWASLGLLDPPPRRGIRVSDPDLKALARRALDAATAAGASYADVRFSVIRRRTFRAATGVNPLSPQVVAMTGPPDEAVTYAVGVRALARGAWGFLADTELTPEMMEWLGRKAGELGKANAWPKCPPIELGERPPVAVGTWQMPGRDPFTVPDAEHQDMMREILNAMHDQRAQGVLKFNYERQERTFASTDGSFTTQTVYNTFANDGFEESQMVIRIPSSTDYLVPIISPRGMGFEVFEREKFLDRMPEWVARANDKGTAEPLETPGRFDVVFDADAMAGIVSIMGASLEIDRALGYEANSNDGGTSYLSPFEKVLGTSPFPAPVTVMANRTVVGGVATVQWDDEGVAPQDYPLIKDGKLMDYATSREFVPEMAAWYKAHGQSVQSRGCAGSENALSVPLVQTPNLRLSPGAKDTSFDELVAGVEDGIAFLGGDLQTDQQQLTAVGGGTDSAIIYAIKKGKLAWPIKDARYMLRMPEFWKDLAELGGERSAGTRGFTVSKGQPRQFLTHSVQAVAARFHNVTVRGLSRG